MVGLSSTLKAWADLLRYPDEAGVEPLRSGLRAIGAAAPQLEARLSPISRFVEERPGTDLEELFTRTFDSNAERALEVGWHLHGENYARGAFMARMRQLLRDHGIEESAELPDHVSHVLQVIARAKEPLAEALAQDVVQPALAKIVDGFSDEANPYLGVVAGLQEFLGDRFGTPDPVDEGTIAAAVSPAPEVTCDG